MLTDLNPRIRRKRQMLFNALSELLAEKSSDDILGSRRATPSLRQRWTTKPKPTKYRKMPLD